jgi:hypothetical protein
MHTTDRQLARSEKITSYGKAMQWQNILDLFEAERDDYSIPNLATTLSQLTISTKRRIIRYYARFYVSPRIGLMNR